MQNHKSCIWNIRAGQRFHFLSRPQAEPTERRPSVHSPNFSILSRHSLINNKACSPMLRPEMFIITAQQYAHALPSPVITEKSSTRQAVSTVITCGQNDRGSTCIYLHGRGKRISPLLPPTD
jgi:hypothetical protein